MNYEGYFLKIIDITEVFEAIFHFSSIFEHILLPSSTHLFLVWLYMREFEVFHLQEDVILVD